MKRTICLTTIIALCIGFYSCKKEGQLVQKPVADGKILNYILNGENIIQELTYTTDSLIYEVIEPYSYKKHFYNAARQLEKTEEAYSASPFSCAMIDGPSREGDDPRKAPVSRIFNFEYSGGKLSKKSFVYIVNGTPNVISYDSYLYESDKIKQISTYNPDGKLMNYKNYTVNDDGNLTREEYWLVKQDGSSSMLSAIEYQFDNKNNPYRVFAGEGIPGVNTNRNNVITATYIYYNQGSGSRSSTPTKYQYNKYDYPVSTDYFNFLYLP